MAKTPDYGMCLELEGSIDELRPRVEAALKAEGFGVLTEIDVQETLKKKIDLDTEPYLILGACNPHLAAKALESEPYIGLFLPCNVVLRQLEPGRIEVSSIYPKVMLELAVGSSALAEIAEDATARITRVLAALASGASTSA